MDERLASILNFVKRNIDRLMVAALLLALGCIIFVTLTEEVYINPSPNVTPYEMPSLIPNENYTATLDFIAEDPDLGKADKGKYQDVQIFNPFDRRIILQGKEVEKRLNASMREANAAFQSGEFDRCIEICNQVLSMDFNRLEAKQLKKRSQDALDAKK